MQIYSKRKFKYLKFTFYLFSVCLTNKKDFNKSWIFWCSCKSMSIGEFLKDLKTAEQTGKHFNYYKQVLNHFIHLKNYIRAKIYEYPLLCKGIPLEVRGIAKT